MSMRTDVKLTYDELARMDRRDVEAICAMLELPGMKARVEIECDRNTDQFWFFVEGESFAFRELAEGAKARAQRRHDLWIAESARKADRPLDPTGMAHLRRCGMG